MAVRTGTLSTQPSVQSSCADGRNDVSHRLAHTARRNDGLLIKAHKEGRAALAYVVVVEWWPPQQAQYSYKTHLKTDWGRSSAVH